MNTQTLKRGALAGAGGGMVMAMWSMIVLWLTGAGFWTPLNLIANTVWRSAPLGATFSGGAPVLRPGLHLMISMAPRLALPPAGPPPPRPAPPPAVPALARTVPAVAL